MVVHEFSVDSCLVQYRSTYPTDKKPIPELTAWLLHESKVSTDVLKDIAASVKQTLTTESQEKQAECDVSVPRTFNSSTVTKLVRGIVVSDKHFRKLTDVQLAAASNMGILQRAARKEMVPFVALGMDTAALKAAIQAARSGASAAGGKDAASDDDQQSSDGEWTVKEILDKRIIDGVLKYKLLWEEDGDVTWEPIENLEGIEELLEKFEAARKAAKGKGRKAKKPPRKETLTEQGEDDGEGKSYSADEKVAILLESLNGLSQSQQDFIIELKKRAADKKEGDKKEGDKKEASTAPFKAWEPMLKGHKREAEVGIEHLQAERSIRRTKKVQLMESHLPFAPLYNQKLKKIMFIEQEILAVKLELKKLQQKVQEDDGDQGELQAQVQEVELKLKFLHNKWLIKDDKMEFLCALSGIAVAGEVDVAAQMWLDAKQEDEETPATKEIKSRKDAAEKKLKDKGKRDQQAVIALMAGGTRGQQAIGSSTLSKLEEGYQAMGSCWQGRSNITGEARMLPPTGGPWAQLQGMANYSGPPSWASPGKSSDGQFQQHQFVPPPPPPPAYGTGAGDGKGGSLGKGGKKGGGGAASASRARFEAAEDKLGNRMPQALAGHMIPTSMLFYTPGKTLLDPPKQRDRPFNLPCKLCAEVGHEAFECMAGLSAPTCTYGSKPAVGYRKLLQLGVVNANGVFQ